jgi:hypothetical protein
MSCCVDIDEQGFCRPEPADDAHLDGSDGGWAPGASRFGNYDWSESKIGEFKVGSKQSTDLFKVCAIGLRADIR